MRRIDMDPVTAAILAAQEVDGAAPPPPEGASEGGPPLEAEGATFPLNDFGNGRRVCLYFGRDLMFVPRLGWHVWDGRRWAADEDEIEVRKLAQKVSERILREQFHLEVPPELEATVAEFKGVEAEMADLRAVAEADRTAAQVKRLDALEVLHKAYEAARDALSKIRSAHVSHARNSGNSSKISNMLTEASTTSAVRLAELNKEPMHVCCENGVIRLRLAPDPHSEAWGGPSLVPRADVIPHHRDQRMTKMLAAPYEPDAPRPHFEAFLERILPDPELRGLLKRWFGYCLTGDTSEQKLIFLYGQGRNGKSTLVDVIAKILADYGATLPIESLTGAEQRKGSDATPDLVRLPGARFVRASEPEQGQRMKEALIKALTGGEPILVRRMMQEFIEIQPEFKLTLSGNYKPEVRGADDGIWRRIMLVPFGEQIPLSEVDRALSVKLWAERAGILAWMVEGALEWMDKGLAPPASILEATEDYRRDSDPLRVFLETECEITGDKGDQVNAKFLGDAFRAWMVGNGDAEWRPRAVSLGLRKRSETLQGPDGARFWLHKAGTNFYRGVKLRPEAKTRAEVYQSANRIGPVNE